MRWCYPSSRFWILRLWTNSIEIFKTSVSYFSVMVLCCEARSIEICCCVSFEVHRIGSGLDVCKYMFDFIEDSVCRYPLYNSKSFLDLHKPIFWFSSVTSFKLLRKLCKASSFLGIPMLTLLPLAIEIITRQFTCMFLNLHWVLCFKATIKL